MKNYIYLIIGILYFSFYFYSIKFDNDKNIFSEFDFYVWNGDYILSYINAIIGFIISIGIIGIFNKYFEKIITILFSKTENKIDDLFGIIIVKFIKIAKYVISIYFAFNLAKIPEVLYDFVEALSGISIIILTLVLLTSFINTIFEENLIFKDKIHGTSKQLMPFINKVILIVIWIIGIITIISNMGYDASALITGAGIGGLAVALAAQKSLINVFGAITILLNKPFKIGDFISVGGHMGTVKDIGLAYLTINDKMGHQIMIPNEIIISTSIENLSQRINRRTDFSIGLIYGTPLKQVEKGVKIIENILEKYVEEKTISNYRVNFDAFGEFSLNILITYYSLINNDYDLYTKQKEQINLKVKSEFEKAKLEMAFPTRELIIKKGTI